MESIGETSPKQEHCTGPGGASPRAQNTKAAGFIVTIYGDVVEQRGGVAWIGNLIDTCSQIGISESLVRTAVSRLVSAGQLVGECHGRRSFYRLSLKSKSEFTAAARLLFGPPEPGDWRFVHLTGPAPDEDMAALERSGYARLGPRLALGSRPSGVPLPSAVVFKRSGIRVSPIMDLGPLPVSAGYRSAALARRKSGDCVAS